MNSRTTAERRAYMRQWRINRRKKLKLDRIDKVRGKFFEGYWKVAGHFFAVKSSLNPQVIFNSPIELAGQKKFYPKKGYIRYGEEIRFTT